MEKHGLKIIDAIRIPNYGGSIRICATPKQKHKSKQECKTITRFRKRKDFLNIKIQKI